MLTILTGCAGWKPSTHSENKYDCVMEMISVGLTSQKAIDTCNYILQRGDI